MAAGGISCVPAVPQVTACTRAAAALGALPAAPVIPGLIVGPAALAVPAVPVILRHPAAPPFLCFFLPLRGLDQLEQGIRNAVQAVVHRQAAVIAAHLGQLAGLGQHLRDLRVMPVKTDNDEIMNYAHEIVDALEAKNVRVELDDRAEKLGYRMREGQIQKVPYLLVIGFNEQENKTVSYRLHGQQDTTTLGLDEFVEKIDTEIKNKAR